MVPLPQVPALDLSEASAPAAEVEEVATNALASKPSFSKKMSSRIKVG